MKKTIILFIFLKLLIIKADDTIDLIFKGKCEDDKAKTGACMYEIEDYDSKGHDKYALFDKCGKGEVCNGYEMCSENFEKKKRTIGKSCNYDEDCTTGLCESNKCKANKEGEKCKSSSSCERGLYCNYSGDTPKCVKYAKKGEKAEKTICMPGLGTDKDSICVKYGTIDDKEKIMPIGYDFELVCKSGYAHQVYDDASKSYIYICDSIKTEPECKEVNLLKTEGKWSDDTSITQYCYTKEDYAGNKISYNTEYSKLKSKLFADFLEDYNDLDLDKINSNDKYTSWTDGMKWKTKEKLYLYQYATHLKAAGIIDSEGKVVKDKQCEYDFIIKNYIHSSFIKLNTIILAIIALLF